MFFKLDFNKIEFHVKLDILKIKFYLYFKWNSKLVMSSFTWIFKKIEVAKYA